MKLSCWARLDVPARDDLVVQFICAALAAGEKCTCVVDSCAPDYVLRLLDVASDVSDCCEMHQLEVLRVPKTLI